MTFGLVCLIASIVFVATLVNCIGLLKIGKCIKDLNKYHEPEDICLLVWMILLTVFGISFEYLFIVSKLNP